MLKIPIGFCQCGCGQKTRISHKTVNRLGWIKGQPIRYINGHNNPRLIDGVIKGRRGYSLIRKPNHPRANQGRIYEYILKAEIALGKLLPEKVVIHHHTTDQLVICEDQSYHMLLELRTRALRACGNVQFRKCLYCQRWDAPNNLHHQSNGLGCYHKECRSIYRQSRLPRNLMQNGI